VTKQRHLIVMCLNEGEIDAFGLALNNTVRSLTGHSQLGSSEDKKLLAHTLRNVKALRHKFSDAVYMSKRPMESAKCENNLHITIENDGGSDFARSRWLNNPVMRWPSRWTRPDYVYNERECAYLKEGFAFIEKTIGRPLTDVDRLGNVLEIMKGYSADGEGTEQENGTMEPKARNRSSQESLSRN